MVLLALWSVLYIFFISGIQHARGQHELYATFRGQAAQSFVPFGGVISPGTPVAMISAPKAGLHDEVIVEGTSSAQLREGPGHFRTTPMPGQPGVSLIYGRSLAFGAPFGGIASLTPGDVISVTTGQGQFAYRVSDVRRPGDLLPALPAGGSRLTLATSESSGWQSGWAPSHVVYVDATLQGAPQPDPGGRLSGVAKSETLMARQTDPLTLMTILLWLQLLAATGCVVAWAQVRWGRPQVWLVGAPALLAGIWGLSNAAVALLPNLM
jgi:sortase A